jgi:Domain of unknown function (DUF1844)
MTTPPLNEDALANASTAEIHSALFAQLVTGHGQMSLMFLGKLENPQTGKFEEVNAEAAKIFIDQLEMLEAKTKGNLTAEEAKLLTQILNTSRLAFVESIDTRLADAGHPSPNPTAPPAAS